MIELLDIISYVLHFCNGAELFSLENTSHSLKDELNLVYTEPLAPQYNENKECQICKSVEHIEQKYITKSIFSVHWSSCKYCLYKILYSRTKYLLCNKNLCDECFTNPETISDRNLNFYRKSQNIIQIHGKIPTIHGQFLLYCKDHSYLLDSLAHPVNWGLYFRSVSLENLILHNRHLFGYSVGEYPLKINSSIVDYITIENIRKRIIKCYHIANEFYFLSLCLRQKKILNSDLLRTIYSFWRYFKF